MGDKTRSISEKKEFIKLCLGELLQDGRFLSTLRETIASEVERVFHDRFEEMAARVESVQNVNKALSDECDMLSIKCDSLEQYSRRTSIRISGLKDVPHQEVEANVINILQEKLNLNIDQSTIDRCHPIGKPKNGNRSVLVKFLSYRQQREVLANRSKLKGTGIGISEDLTKTRYGLNINAVKKYGRKFVWTLDGKIYVKFRGKKYTIVSDSDFNTVPTD